MKQIELHGVERTSKIAINESFLNLLHWVGNRNRVIITDSNVRNYYGDYFKEWNIIEIGIGETCKTLKTIEYIYEELVKLEADRSWFIIGMGGGIVCDITGFAASTYMRGVPFGFVSTSLLSQVDASIGGKNGVNFHGYKNMIGVFNQPEFVICDTTMLKTLPEVERANGFAEVVKHAVIGDERLFNLLEEHPEKASNLDPLFMENVIYACLEVKKNVVEKDEKEKGERRVLNFGHTLGHALEKVTGISHGSGVSIGMMFAAGLSVKRNLLAEGDAIRLRNVLISLGLPVTINCEKSKLKEAIHKDKKREGRGIHFILLKSIGKPVIQEIGMDELEEEIDNDLCLH